jgi:hypothetical protein
MRFPEAHIERIEQLGYSESEAQFLYLVAVFSGYFTLRQFRAFSGSRSGKRPTSFARKLIENEHARVCARVRTAALFHLFSRKLYGEMDKDNLRNRKRHSFDFMRTRLLLLDFILANPEYTYFETEQEKVDFFCKELCIPVGSLPAKVYEGASPDQQTIRRFVDKFPLFLASPLCGLSPVVTFSYIDSGFQRSFHFASHLATYRSLFQQLESFRFVYVAAKEAYFPGAEERFRSVVRRPLEADLSGDILRFFSIRKKWENHEYVIPVTADLEFLSEGRRRFHGDQIESLYKSWRSHELNESELRAKISQQKPERAVFFDTFLIKGTRSSGTELAEPGDRCMKDTGHPSAHRPVHTAENESAEEF